MEIMITVAVIGILGKIAIDTGLFQFQRESINNVSNRFAGWLEEISNVPTKNNSASSIVCEISLSTGDTAQGAGLATVIGKDTAGTILSPNPCSSEPTFKVPNLYGGILSVASSLTTWTYTPRGSINSSSDIEIKLALKGLAPVRCISIGNTLGLIELGRIDNTSNVASTTSCTYDFRQ
ncbi:MAG: hypothetical protein ACK5JJ_14735 [Cyanobacteriota bacterium]